MREFQRDLEVIAQNANVEANVLTFHFHNYDVMAKRPIEDLGMECRAFNGLKRNGINTIGEIIDKWDTLNKLRYVGATTIKAIKNAVVAFYYDTLDTEEKKQFWRETFCM